MPKFVAGSVQDFPPGSQTCVAVDGRNVAVFNVDGSYYALRDICPHRGAELSAGLVVGSLRSSDPGCYEYDTAQKLVKCPWHGWEFDLVTGASWFDPKRERVRPYAVSVEAGDTLAASVGRTGIGRVPGPYAAETIPISVEDEYLVIEL